MELHNACPGVTRMKQLAGSVVWWSLMDHDIVEMVKSYPECQLNRPDPPSAPLSPW